MLLWHTEDTEGIIDLEGMVIGVEGGNLSVYDWYSGFQRTYSYARKIYDDVQSTLESMYANREYWKTQIPYYREVNYAFENEQYWKDYKKNTGFTPRYPYRAYGKSGEQALQAVSRGFRNVKRLYG